MKNLIPPFIQHQYNRQVFHGTFRAYTLFVDLSGFTPLTEDLMQAGPRGAEELSALLNEIFEPLVGLVYARGGFIPYFAGDAFTALFPERDAQLAAHELVRTAALAREMFRNREYRFGRYTIGIKFGLSYGEVEWGIVGDQLKSFYFRGNAIDRAAYCQTLAHDQDIVVDDIIRDRLSGRALHLEEISPNTYRILGHLPVDNIKLEPRQPPAIQAETALHFLPEEVVEYQHQGEFRTVISIFISFQGLNTHEQLDEFVSVVLRHIDTFSGYFKEIDFGDKGAVLACFFGAPVSFENNISRALEFILTVREELWQLRQVQSFSFRAGITMGTAFTGIVGGKERCQYACVGNRVNLAARIMTFADWGEILADAEIHKNPYFRFLHKGDIKFKGIAGNIPTFKLMGRSSVEKPTYTGQMIERREELDQLVHAAEPLFEGRSAGIAYVYGEAGIGKSRLTYEMRRHLMREKMVQWHVCQADQILRKPLNPFIYFLKSYFEQSPDSSVPGNRTSFETRFQLLSEELRQSTAFEAERALRELNRTRTILAALIGIPYPDSLWDQLDAKGRYQNAMAAIINLLLAESLINPTVIELEDTHWIDDTSLELLQELVRRMYAYPVMLVVTARYLDDGTRPRILHPAELEQRQIPVLEIDLSSLPASAVRTFSEATLGGPISDEFFELLLRTTNSNPFYLEQVLNYFIESKLVEIQEGEWTIRDKNIKLSESINSILTARIDRLSALVRETVKAAAVIGREFELPVLSEVLKNQEEFSTEDTQQQMALLREQIKTAEQGQIWMAMNELRYIFRHSLLREAAYSMQLRARLQQLHLLVAQAIEKLDTTNIEERYVDLAFHYEQAGDFDKTCEYLRKAADYARSNYQNQQALDFYERLLKKLGHRTNILDEIRTHIKRAKVLELIGNWDEARASFEQALRLAKKSRDVLLLGQANNGLGHLLMLQGDYQQAMQYLQIAVGLFESIDDQVGICKIYGDLGHLHFRRAQYDRALDYFEKSLNLGFAKAGSSGTAQIVSHLGLTHMNRGHFERGIEVIRRQIPIHEQHSDKQGLAILYTNLGIVQYEKGDHEEALESYREGLQLAEELGNKQLVAIATGCIGSVFERQGRYEAAMEHFQRDLEICEELGDKQGIAIALGLIGELLSIMGNFSKAIEYLQKNLMLCEELGYRKGIAKAVNTLGDIFFFTRQYDRALQFYNRAIQMSREIDNRLVLGFSLVEKGSVLLATNRLAELKTVEDEALRIAEDLGNPDLLVEALLLQVRTATAENRTKDALKTLKRICAMPDLHPEQEAAVALERFNVNPEDQEAKELATQRFTALHAATPKFIYRKCLRELGVEVPGEDHSEDFVRSPS